MDIDKKHFFLYYFVGFKNIFIMKNFVLALLCTVLAFGIGANAAVKADIPDDDKVKVAAAVVVSDKPGQEGVQILKNFQAGDDVNLITRHSSKRMRKQALKMAEDLCRIREISYEQYVQLAKDLDLKPKSEKKLL